MGEMYVFNQGALVWMPFFPLMRSEENWEDAGTFLPERFLQENAELAAGPRPTLPSTPALPGATTAKIAGGW